MKSKLYLLSQFRFFALFMIMCLLGASVIAPVQAQQNNTYVASHNAPLKPKVSSAPQNFSQSALSTATVSGVVTNASTGAPLAADIYIPEYPGSPVSTDPITGAYSIQLDYGTDYHFSVVSTGFITGTATINPASPTITQDFPLGLDIAACTAPGYKRVSGFSQNFNTAAFPPSGWEVTDKAGEGVVWKLNSKVSNWDTNKIDDNYTGGTGTAADANSDAAHSDAHNFEYDTILTSPLITVAGLPGQYLTYNANYQDTDIPLAHDFLKLDIQVDNGAWTNVLSWNEDHGTQYDIPGEGVVVDLSSRLSGHSNFRLRWHYYDSTTGDWDYYAQIDDVSVGNCVVTQTASFQSSGVYDGWIRETNETSNVGGATNTISNLLYIGDDALDRQYKSLMSFNTNSLPDNAVVASVKLRFKIQGFVGGNMFTPTKTLGNLLMDIRKPYFGTGRSLIGSDFQAVANKDAVGALGSAPTTGWRTVTFKATSFQFVNLNGTTQLRLRFTKDDNDDLSADYLKIFSGNAPSANRPKLIVEYYVVP